MEIVDFNLPDADVILYPHFIAEGDAANLLETLYNTVDWRSDKIVIFGKEVSQPRLTAWYSDDGKDYTYSGLTMPSNRWTKELKQLKTQIEQLTHHSFNSLLINLYRNCQDSMGWHSDDEKELGRNPVIASVSLGQERVFKLKHRYKPELPVTSIPLSNGSLLLMKGTTQHYWKHSLPKSAKPMAKRINLTFRWIV